MTEDEKQAFAIYEMIVATSKDRPSAFQTVEQMRRETAAWKANNPAFAELDRADPRKLLAFLAQSFAWLRAEAHLAKNYSACSTLAENLSAVSTGISRVLRGHRFTTPANRFEYILVWRSMRQHQFASLCRARGWESKLMSANFDGANVPTKKLDPWDMRVEFYADIPSDRDSELLESALGEQSGAGINLFIGSDQVRFYRNGREVA